MSSLGGCACVSVCHAILCPVLRLVACWGDHRGPQAHQPGDIEVVGCGPEPPGGARDDKWIANRRRGSRGPGSRANWWGTRTEGKQSVGSKAAKPVAPRSGRRSSSVDLQDQRRRRVRLGAHEGSAGFGRQPQSWAHGPQADGIGRDVRRRTQRTRARAWARGAKRG